MMKTLEETAANEAPPQEHGRPTMKFTYPPESRPLDGYTIKRGIQRGGFGEVYYAVSDAGKEVALKLLQNNMEVELRGVSQCLNLKHPNLVTIFDIRRDADGDHWIVMEYVHGKTLDQTIHDRPGQMPVDEVQQWLSGLAAGLTFLHERGIVHRDLKPANIYRESGCVKIGDVGLSKFISDSRRHAQTQSVGTVYYMAPEVARGQYGREVDVYALGIILYEMLTGRVPFDGESTAEILMKHLAEKPNLDPLPKRLRPVIARALEKDPMRRTASAKQFEEEFRRAILGFENAAVPPPLPVEPAAAQPVPVRFVAEPRPASAGYGHPDASGVSRRAGENRPSTLATVALVLVGLWFVAVVLGHGGHGDRIVWRLGFLAAVGYVIYRVVRPSGGHRSSAVAAVEPAYRSEGYRRATPCAVRHQPAHRRVSLNPHTRRSMSPRIRAMELTGSMTIAAFAAAIVTAGLAMFPSFFESPVETALFGATTLLGAWAVLIPSKLTEGSAIDGSTRRVFQLAGGLAAGAAAAWLSGLLDANIGDGPLNRHHGGFVRQVGNVFMYGPERNPTLAGYLAFFGSLFLLRHWWMHADAFRRHRFRVLSLLLTTALGYMLTILWSFPPLWGTVWAAAISMVVQLSASWMPQEERGRLAEEQHHA